MHPLNHPVKLPQLLSRIRWLAAAQDGSMDTAQAALFEIEDLAAQAATLASPSPLQHV